MDVGNSQYGDDDNDRHLARLCEIYFPTHHQHQHQPQPQPQQGYVAPEMDLAEHRRHLEELYKKKAEQYQQQQQQMMLQQMYWQQMQQPNQIVQNPYQFMNSQANKVEKKEPGSYLVAAGNLEAADEWAWRKYGQKPIKGCTYPRSYYKCSSSKGCKAKKQVEKVLVDPDVYMVTYKGEHSHMNPVQPLLHPGSVLASIFGHTTTNPVSEMPPQPPLEIAPEAAVEEDKDHEKVEDVEEPLLIPNLMMVDQDMLTSMEELKNYYNKYDGSGHVGFGSGSSFSSTLV